MFFFSNLSRSSDPVSRVASYSRQNIPIKATNQRLITALYKHAEQNGSQHPGTPSHNRNLWKTEENIR